MSNKSGRPKTHKFNSEDFKKLSTEERRLRGRISTLRRMIKKRESDIEELMKPILKKRKEIKKIQTELYEITEVFNTSNYNFPKFRIEGYISKDRSYYRGVWYVNGKKKQKYLGSETKIHSLIKSSTKGFDSLNQVEKNKKILEHFLPSFQLDFWNKEYEDFKKQ